MICDADADEGSVTEMNRDMGRYSRVRVVSRNIYMISMMRDEGR